MATRPLPSHQGKITQEIVPARTHLAGAGRLACLDAAGLADRVEQWDRLALRASEPNPFLESWYLLPSLRALADKRVEILCYEHDGDLLGLMPIAYRHSYYGRPAPHVSNWLHDNCFLGVPLVATGAEVAFWQAVLDWADQRSGQWLFLHLAKLPLGGPLHAALMAVAAMQDRRCEVVMREQRALLQSDLSPEHYWEASLSAKKRKELRRQARRLGELGSLSFERSTDSEGLESWSDAFLTLEAAGWKGKAGSALAGSAATAKLFREALSGAAQRGRLERLALCLDGRPIAMLANFLASPGAFSFKTAFDEGYARFSPGVLLQQHNLDLLKRPGIAWADSCAAADHPMIDHIWRERRSIGHVSIAIGGRLRRFVFNRLIDFETARLSGENTP